MNKIFHQIAAEPWYQMLTVLAIAIFFALIDHLFASMGSKERSADGAWIVMTSFILFYALVTCVLSLRAQKMNKYWAKSIMAFVALLFISAGFAYLLSGATIDEAGSFRWIFVVMTIGYVTFLAIVRLMRKIVDLAIEQDERLRGG